MDVPAVIQERIEGKHTREEPKDLQDWINQGKPYVWHVSTTETSFRFDGTVTTTLWYDTSRELLVLIENNKIVGMGKDFVRSGNYVGLGTYYGSEPPALFKKI